MIIRKRQTKTTYASTDNHGIISSNQSLRRIFMSKSPNSQLWMEWERRMTDYKASDQTQVQWCQSQNISIHQFRYWSKRIKDHHTKKLDNPWVPVVIEDPKPELCESIQIKVGSVSIEVNPGFNPTLLAEVIKVLKDNVK